MPTVFRALTFGATLIAKSFQMLKLATLVTGSITATKADFSTPPATTLSSAAGHQIHLTFALPPVGANVIASPSASSGDFGSSSFGCSLMRRSDCIE